MKKILALLLALAMVFALAACGQKPADKPEEKPAETQQQPAETQQPEATQPSEEKPEEPAELTGDPIKIGHIADLTVSEAWSGNTDKTSLEFAVKHLNGISGRPVEVITLDATGTPDGAIQAARTLVETHEVAAIFGPNQAGQKAGVSTYCAEVGGPLVFYNGTPDYLFKTNPYLLGCGGANSQMTMMADYCYNELGYRKVNLLTMDNTGFRTFADSFATAFESLGGEIAKEAYAPLPCDDWAPYLMTMDLEADAILAWTTATNAIALWQNWYDMGMSDKMPMTGLMQSAFTDAYIIEQVEMANPDAAEAILGTVVPSMCVYTTGTPENDAFVAAWEAEFGEKPDNNISGQMYQAYQLFKLAVESIDGNTEADAVRDAMLAQDFEGPAGHMKFDGSGACTKDVYIVKAVRMDDGTFNYETVKVYKDVPPEGMLSSVGGK